MNQGGARLSLLLQAAGNFNEFIFYRVHNQAHPCFYQESFAESGFVAVYHVNAGGDEHEDFGVGVEPHWRTTRLLMLLIILN